MLMAILGICYQLADERVRMCISVVDGTFKVTHHADFTVGMVLYLFIIN